MTDYYSRLLDLRRAEGAARELAKIPSDFYPQTRTYLAQLRTTYEAELRENPSGKKGELARQTHQRGLQMARDIVEARMTKILAAALQAGLGGNRELLHALPEERDLLQSLVGLLREHRSQVAPYLEPSGPSVPPAPPKSPADPARTGPPAPAPPASPEAATSAPRAATEGNPIPEGVRVVRMLASSPRIAMGNESLELRREDVVSLSPEVARTLVEGQVAVPVEPALPAARRPS